MNASHPLADPVERPVDTTVGISVVVPIYNEEECLPELRRRLAQTLSALDPSFEVIFVNDGSRDGSLALMRKIAAEDRHFRVLNLSRNFGHQIAVTAGLDYARGAVVVLIDADLQDPPEVIGELYTRYLEGYDVVYAVRSKREKESAFKLMTARLFYRLFRWTTDIDMPLDTGDFRLMSRDVVDALSRMRERHRMLRAMVSWVGFRQSGVLYERAGRYAGTTKYPLRKMAKFAFDGIASFSSVPLKLASWAGAGVSVLCFGYLLFAIASKLAGHTEVGWTSLMVALTFLGGVQLICLGIMGEYLGRIYDEVKGRPLYLVSEFITDGAQPRHPARKVLNR